MTKHYLQLPDKNLLMRTGEVDYYNWTYQFPIKYLMRFRYKKVLDLLGEKKYDSILEAGTGSGIFLPELSKHCKELYACDIHNYFDHIASMCDQCGVKNYHLCRQSIDKTNYPDKFFDAVVALSMLEFVPDIEKAVNEIKRILREDGVFITILPMESAILDFFLSFYVRKSPKEEFSDARKKVSKVLEENFSVLKKGFLTPLVGKYFPVYTYYKLEKPVYKGSTITLTQEVSKTLKRKTPSY
ncbi:MAG TPA: class I SAM-dependent methyltransferase [Hanamia sp.]|jgi:ubiquinone/menaquinone biosynthesis C-methylase UbiE|nr:class I SAM-dependent methyltransferase [Hanamia sp.]